MSSIPAAKDRLSHLGRFINTALPPRLAWVQEDVETLLAELSRLEEIETLMTWFGSRTNLELDWGAEDEESDAFWSVHSVNGGVNDREWTLVGIGRSPIEAIRNAKARLITKGGADV